MYSCMVNKANKWEEKVKTIFVISNFGQVDLLNEMKRVRHSVKITDLKSLTWIHDDVDHDSQEISINSKTSHDYKVYCNNIDEKEQIFSALKYLYWKVNGINLPIYAVPKSLIKLYFNSKGVDRYQRA